MGNYWLPIIIGFFIGAMLTVVALAIVRGGKREDIEADPEKEEAAKQWNQQSKGYK
jgi:hypothetical protein